MKIVKLDLEPNPREVISKSPDDDIYVSVEIGNGQIGANNIKIKDKLLAKGNISQATYIGKVSDLSEEVVVESNVLDVNSFTNVCVITTTFRNQHNTVLFSKVDNGDAPENGIASFKGKYLFRVLVILLVFFCPVVFT
jgi:hypothetical protein